MSFDLNWEALTEHDAILALKESINDRIKQLDTTQVLHNLCLNTLSLPTNPPELAIEDILPPHPHFLAQFDVPEAKDDDGVQIVLRMQWHASITAELSGEVALNYPAPGFARLPVRLCVKEVRLNGTSFERSVNENHASEDFLGQDWQSNVSLPAKGQGHPNCRIFRLGNR